MTARLPLVLDAEHRAAELPSADALRLGLAALSPLPLTTERTLELPDADGALLTGADLEPLSLDAAQRRVGIDAPPLFATAGSASPFQLSVGGWQQSGRGFAVGQFERNLGVVGATAAVDWAAGQHQRLALTDDTDCTVTLLSPPGPCLLTLSVVNPPSGTVPSVSWSHPLLAWAGGSPPALSTTLGARTMIELYFDGAYLIGLRATEIEPLPLVLAGALPEGLEGIPYSGGLIAAGGIGAYTFALTAGSLPSGATFDAATGLITWPAPVLGSWPLTIQVSDEAAGTASADVTLLVVQPSWLSDLDLYRPAGSPLDHDINLH